MKCLRARGEVSTGTLRNWRAMRILTITEGGGYYPVARENFIMATATGSTMAPLPPPPTAVQAGEVTLGVSLWCSSRWSASDRTSGHDDKRWEIGARLDRKRTQRRGLSGMHEVRARSQHLALVTVFAVSGLLQSCGPESPPTASAALAPARPPGQARATEEAATSRPAPEPRVPAAFQGEWNAEPTACGTGLHDSRLVIAEHEIRFYESGGPVRAARLLAPDRLEVEIAMRGEGDVWTERRTLQLSADGATLTDLTHPERQVRRRCQP